MYTCNWSAKGTVHTWVLSLQMECKIKCTDLNRYTFSSMFSNEKVYLFKSAHFNAFPWFQFDLMNVDTGDFADSHKLEQIV